MTAQVTRLELSRRYRLRASAPLSDADAAAFAALVHDRMTEEASTLLSCLAGPCCSQFLIQV